MAGDPTGLDSGMIGLVSGGSGPRPRILSGALVGRAGSITLVEPVRVRRCGLVARCPYRQGIERHQWQLQVENRQRSIFTGHGIQTACG